MTEKLIESFQGLADAVIQGAPKVITGIMLVILALIVAKVVEKVLRAILVRVKFDNLVKRTGIDQTLQRVGIRQELNYFIPRLVYFLILLLLAKTLSDTLGLVAVSDALSSFFAYLPNVIAALLLVVLGSAAGHFAGGAVTQAAESSGIDFAPALGRLVAGLVFFIIGIMVLAQLKIDTEIIRLVTAFGLAGCALAFGLSFGLGSREVVRNFLAGFYARKLLRIGDEVEIGGQRGTLKAVTPTHMQLEVENHTLSISNGTFLDQVAKQ